MASIPLIILGLLILQIHVNGKPSDTSNQEEIDKVDETNIKLDSEPYEIAQEEGVNDDSLQSARQKRYFNYPGYFPSINPLMYPYNDKKDQSSETGAYGTEDYLVQIHRKLQEIADLAKQPVPPQVTSPVPIFVPFLYMPQVGCSCSTATSENIPSKPTVSKNQTNPNPDNRFGGANDNDEEDFSRPISFTPIKPNRGISRPVPPVEHGSKQSKADSIATTTEQVPSLVQAQVPSLVQAQVPSLVQSQVPSLPQAQGSSAFQFQQPIINRFPDEPQRPTDCDGAVLRCCHQKQVTYDCFKSQGCPNPPSPSNPCDIKDILKVIESFQLFYGQRNGWQFTIDT